MCFKYFFQQNTKLNNSNSFFSRVNIQWAVCLETVVQPAQMDRLRTNNNQLKRKFRRLSNPKWDPAGPAADLLACPAKEPKKVGEEEKEEKAADAWDPVEPLLNNYN